MEQDVFTPKPLNWQAISFENDTRKSDPRTMLQNLNSLTITMNITQQVVRLHCSKDLEKSSTGLQYLQADLPVQLLGQ